MSDNQAPIEEGTPPEPTEEQLAAGSSSINPQQVRQVQALGLNRGLLACRFDPTGKFIVAGGMNGQLSQLTVNWETAETPIHVEAHKSWVGALAFSPDGSRLYSGDYTGQVHCWSFPFSGETPQPLWSAAAHQGWLRSLAVSPDGKLLTTGGNDYVVRLWSTSDGAPIAELKSHESDVYTVLFHPDGQSLVSGDLLGIVKQWDANSHALVRDLEAKQMFVQQDNIRLGGVRGMNFDQAGTVLACTGMSGFGSIGDGIGAATVVLFDWASGKQTHVLLPSEQTRSFANGAAFFDGDLLMAATGGLDRGFLLFWKPGPGPAPVMPDPNAAADAKPKEPEPNRVENFFRFAMAESGWAMDMHPDGRHFAVAHHDNQLRYFDFG